MSFITYKNQGKIDPSVIPIRSLTTMARRSTPPVPERPVLNADQMRRRIERLQSCIRELEALDLQKVQKRDGDPEVMRIEAAVEDALSAAFGHDTPSYNRYRDAANLDKGPRIMRIEPMWGGRGGGPANYDAQDAHDARQYLAEGKERSKALLQGAISALEAEIADLEPPEAAAASRDNPVRQHDKKKVFVVHGHDEAARLAVARFLEQIGLEAIILSEQPDQGRTIIEKFEECAADVGFAVVLLTPDDLGGGVATAPATSSRARQNVIFELGYFAGKLGRGRACLMRKGAVEIPSDLHGVIYTDMDASDGWKLKLVRELKAAKLDFDANRMWG
jgi:predicted nucleotide-binding protein